MKLGEHQEIFAEQISRLILSAIERGYKVRKGECERSIDQQQIYYKTGRSKTMDSRHLKKCAQDLHFIKDGKLCYPKEIGDLWESMDPLNSWGGNWKSFKDAPHFERRA